MKQFVLFIGAIAAFVCVGCSSRNQAPEENKTVGTSTSIEGDSTLYGLACDGCTDSVLVFLPGKGGDPVTYDIINATMKRRIIGKPKVGDWVAVILNGENPRKADMVIDLDELKGTWVELVMPTKREQIATLDVDPEAKRIQDSIVASLMKPIEIGFSLKRHYTAQPFGRRYRNTTSDEESPVVFPTPKFYTEWHVINGKLVLSISERVRMEHGDSTKMMVVGHDTIDFVLMTKDSLRLKFKDGERGFYRKN
ncbi:MAG: hypothetical protein IJ562_01975 [Prevotella sp.]|nr:hypothetical protein [Prevotella sp.]